MYNKGLMADDEPPTNNQGDGRDPSNELGGESDPDSPASPGSPPFQGVAEEGVLINVAGSPEVSLEELASVEYVDSDANDEDKRSDRLSPLPVLMDCTEPAAQACEDDCGDSQILNNTTSDTDPNAVKANEFCDYMRYVDTNVLHGDENSPEFKYTPKLSPERNKDSGGTCASENELAHLLKNISSSDEG